MTAGAGTVSRPVAVRPGRWPAAGRLLRLELLNNAMLWMLPVAAALFWLTTYRKAMAMPPLWNMRARALQSGALLAFASPVAGAAAWMGSREGRRHTTDLVTVTARPRWVRQLATWAATTCWALVGYLGCVAVLYGVTAQQATWGGPLWWPAVVAAASLPALSALGFAAGAAVPSRFTAPLATIAAFFVLGLSTQLIQRQPVVLAGLATGRRPLGHRARRGCGDLLPLSSRPAHRPGDVPGRAHRGGAGRPGPARGPGRDMAAPRPPRPSPRPACWRPGPPSRWPAPASWTRTA